MYVSPLISPAPADSSTLLPDGRQWGGVFYAEIESSCTKVQARKGGLLQLSLPKKVPLLTWPSLLVSPRVVGGERQGSPVSLTEPDCYISGRRNL